MLSAAKLDMLFSVTTNWLAVHKQTGIAVIVQPNRGAQMDPAGQSKRLSSNMSWSSCGVLVGFFWRFCGVRKEDTTVKEETPDAPMEPDEEHSDDDAEVLKGEEHILRDLRHKIEVTLSQKKRKLLVKDVSFVFEPSSVYGQRSGLAKGWLVTARCGNNRFHKSRPWRQNVVFGINMLARDGMYKPEKAEPSMSAAFTDVQEMKQAAGGSSFIRTIVQSLTEGMPQEAVVLIDATAYDAWPAMASIEARWTVLSFSLF